MTDQPESASEYEELLADLDLSAQGIGPLDRLDAEQIAAVIRALEAKVRALEHQRDTHYVAKPFVNTLEKMLVDADETERELRSDRDRLAGEVERLELRVAHWQQLHEHAINATAALSADAISLTDDNTRLTSELAAARENEARYLWLRDTSDAEQCEYMFDTLELENWDEYIDAARRAGGEG